MKHIPVLLHESIEGLHIQENDVIVDATLGLGGHSSEICSQTKNNIHIIGIDQDTNALEHAKTVLTQENCKTTFLLGNFRDIDVHLQNSGAEKIDGLLVDLGISSYQLDSSGRGFTFNKDEPLLMTMDESNEVLTAEYIVNKWSEETLSDILHGFGEERYSRRIAKHIVEKRKEKPISTTFELVEIIRKAVPWIYTKNKTHFATRTFQALRIAVNDELGALKDVLEKGYDHLNAGGRMVVISFHSLEDRIVKRFFRAKETEGEAHRINKKPITPSEDELHSNPRSRSAKLRILEKNT
ncbi:16S rRNA (cytosine(1402)-N(4))-methyltransferase [Candidatus Wolfebacteria bacterium]|nr:MAG: 16S rRNA (cytosine(1402)-N(4))-methyltransferase [Candidatus Wolfebacteria bacterium]